MKIEKLGEKENFGMKSRKNISATTDAKKCCSSCKSILYFTSIRYVP